jgi:hypothetical protein
LSVGTQLGGFQHLDDKDDNDDKYAKWGQQTIAADAEAVQWEATQDGLQQWSRWTAAAKLQWTAAAAMGNGSAMGGGTAKQLWWAMGRWWHNGWHNGRQRIFANAEVAQLGAAAAITMDGGGMIAMDGGSGNGQWWWRSG